MKVSSHAPSFLPWAGYWNKVALADLFLLTGSTTFDWQSSQNRVTFDGGLATIPVVPSTKHGPIRDVLIAYPETLPAIATRLSKVYRGDKFPYASRLEGLIETLQMMGPVAGLMMANVQLHRIVADLLGIETQTILDTGPLRGTSASRRVADLLLRHDPNPTYYAGPIAKGYLSKDLPPFPVWVQTIRYGTCRDSVLQLIATEPDPADYVRTCAVWEPL
jgi:hypothetical protein